LEKTKKKSLKKILFETLKIIEKIYFGKKKHLYTLKII